MRRQAHNGADPVAVLLACNRQALLAQWLPRLRGTPRISLRGEPVVHATRLIDNLRQHAPAVLLLDKILLDRLDAGSRLQLRQHLGQTRVLLLGDADLASEVLRHRFHGFLLANCGPDICLKAIHAVGNGESWLPRASLGRALADWQELPPADDASLAPASRDVASETLTPRESQVVQRLRRGCTNKEIAAELGIMEDTVKKHLQGVFGKLGVNRRTQVVVLRRPGAR